MSPLTSATMPLRSRCSDLELKCGPFTRCCSPALFLERYLQHHDVARVVSQAVSSLHAIVRGTDANMPGELTLIAMQDALVNAPETFMAESV